MNVRFVNDSGETLTTIYTKCGYLPALSVIICKFYGIHSCMFYPSPNTRVNSKLLADRTNGVPMVMKKIGVIDYGV